MKIWHFLILLLIVLLPIFLLINRSKSQSSEQTIGGNENKKEDNQKVQMKPTPTQVPELVIDKSKKYLAVLHTDKGDITIALNASQTPITVNNFVVLAQKGFYNNTIFHRVIKGFMIQGGDSKGDGTGGPGYQFNDEPFEGDYTRGTVAMANAGSNTNGSQFFIIHGDTPLPKSYVIFGKVQNGMETVDKIAEAPVKQGPTGESSSPITPVKILTVDITSSPQ